ncbi:MAG TPA: hypothetical protein VNJ03_16985 [Vicinamibacterales bacterium]|nr:hypothetical protein [Vicinamibacterales bacterium]
MNKRFQETSDSHDLRSAEQFAADVLRVTELATCDQSLLAAAFLTIATNVAARDLQLRPTMGAFYARTLRASVDRLMAGVRIVEPETGTH